MQAVQVQGVAPVARTEEVAPLQGLELFKEADEGLPQLDVIFIDRKVVYGISRADCTQMRVRGVWCV